MVPAGDAGFCVDSTEVTNAHYRAFYVAALVDAGVQPPYCAWNADLLPSTWGDASPHFAADVAGVPVHNVDWCDAYAYCKWAGKRLCGARAGGPTPVARYAEAGASAWTYACSRGGSTLYPYGNAYDASACFGIDHPSSQGVPTDAGASGCVGGFPGLHDMSGNAWEWEDGCESFDAGGSDLCLLRGGSAFRGAAELTCVSALLDRRDEGSIGNLGFRCCL
jgi:formylglycine-generating enzyme required for sulfatase activity